MENTENMREINVAGFWRRFFWHFIDSFFTGITLGIYLVIIFILFLIGRPNPGLGMKACGIRYSSSSRNIILFLFRFLQNLFYCLIIPLIWDFIAICMKRGTFAERWSRNFVEINQQKVKVK